MSLTARVGLGVVLALGVAGVLLWWNHRSGPVDDGAARAQELIELRNEMAHLRGKVAVLETQASAPPPARESPNVAAPEQPAPQNQNVPPPRRRTREEQTAIFEGYFTKLDGLRGRHEDGALTKQFADSLAAVKPEFKSLHGAKVDSVSCGNGLCRLALTFASAQDLDLGKGELQFQIGPLAEGITMYSDPEQNRVFAYFSTPGTELPPFPNDQND